MIVDNEQRELDTDTEGYLVNPDDWDRTVAEQLASQESIDLTAEHWRVLEFMRNYFEEHGIAADARHVIKYMDEDMGMGKAAHNHLFKLFPYGYVKQACKIAGMKRPRAWSTG
jgi:tRNA 2-thiouridine synthesizing protein E